MVNFSGRSSTFVGMIGVILWIGASLFFAAAVAPTLFRVVEPRSMAGAAVGQLLPVIFLTGIFFALLAAALEVRPPRAQRWMWRLAAALLMAIGCAMAQFGVAPQIAKVRATMSTLPDSSQVLLQPVFGRLHMLSVTWLGVSMLAAASFVFFSWLALRRESNAPPETSQII